MSERSRGSRKNHWSPVEPVVLGLLLAACSSADAPPEAPDTAAPASESPPAGTGGTGTANPTPPTPSSPTNNAPVAPSGPGTGGEVIGGTPPIAMGGAGSDVSGGANPLGTGGAPADPGIALGRCQGGSTTPCGVFVTAGGTEVPLGPYGSIMDVNVGAGFENPIAAGDADGGLTCSLFAGTFGEDAEGTDALLDTEGLRFDLYSVFRPFNVVPGETYPILTWGNGTCAQPAGYATLLHYVASHGYFVVAANSRWVGSATAMVQGIDFLVAANADAQSPYFGLIDTSKVGTMGHSQGGQGARNTASDPRVQTAILFNGGSAASKPFLAISGDNDIGGGTAAGFLSTVTNAPEAAALWYHNIPDTGNFSGHLTLMTQPDRVVEPTVAWFDFILKADTARREFFVGADCSLCNRDDDFEFAQNGLE